MILCSCTRLSTSTLRLAIQANCASQPYTVVTPGRAFRMTNRRMECGRCAALVSEMVSKELACLQAHPAPPPEQRPTTERTDP